MNEANALNLYRNKLKNQNVLFIIGAVILIAVQVLSSTGYIRPVAENGKSPEFLGGFVAGASLAITLLFVIGIIMNLVALRNEEKLKKLFLRETDERTHAIATRGKSAGATVGICALLVAAVIGGYFSVQLFLTILGCDILLALCMIGGKLYYNAKM